MNRHMKWLVLLGAVVLIVVLAYSSMQQSEYQYEVCVTFHGRSHCATAQARTQAEAIHSAQEIDCTMLAGSRDENMACLATEPTSAHPVTGH